MTDPRACQLTREQGTQQARPEKKGKGGHFGEGRPFTTAFAALPGLGGATELCHGPNSHHNSAACRLSTLSTSFPPRVSIPPPSATNGSQRNGLNRLKLQTRLSLTPRQRAPIQRSIQSDRTQMRNFRRLRNRAFLQSWAEPKVWLSKGSKTDSVRYQPTRPECGRRGLWPSRVSIQRRSATTFAMSGIKWSATSTAFFQRLRSLLLVAPRSFHRK